MIKRWNTLTPSANKEKTDDQTGEPLDDGKTGTHQSGAEPSPKPKKELSEDEKKLKKVIPYAQALKKKYQLFETDAQNMIDAFNHQTEYKRWGDNPQNKGCLEDLVKKVKMSLTEFDK